MKATFSNLFWVVATVSYYSDAHTTRMCIEQVPTFYVEAFDGEDACRLAARIVDPSQSMCVNVSVVNETTGDSYYTEAFNNLQDNK